MVLSDDIEEDISQQEDLIKDAKIKEELRAKHGTPVNDIVGKWFRHTKYKSAYVGKGAVNFSIILEALILVIPERPTLNGLAIKLESGWVYGNPTYYKDFVQDYPFDDTFDASPID